MGASSNDTINMAVYAEDRNSMQIWVAKRTSIDLIQMQRNTKDETFWKRTDGIYEMENPPDASVPHQIQIGKAREYLVFKLSSRRYLYLAATCSPNQFFQPDSFSCGECRPAHHSFGLQTQNCLPCNAMWIQSMNDDVLSASHN
jgi:hypothetical protein